MFYSSLFNTKQYEFTTYLGPRKAANTGQREPEKGTKKH